MRKAVKAIALSTIITSSLLSPIVGQSAGERVDKGLLRNLNEKQATEVGYEIAARSDRSDRGFKDSITTMKMILRNSAGRESSRTVRMKTLEIPDENVGDKSVVVFDQPRDVKGTALLSYAKILEADDQWLYLPALKRVKRISSTNKSGPFMGSEFAFEDFTSQELNKFTYKYIGRDKIGDLDVYVVERYPRYEGSGYTKQIAYIDTADFQTRRVVFFDRKGEKLKTLDMTDYKNYGTVAKPIWRPHTMKMVNHQNGKSTDLIYDSYAFKTGLKESDFVKSALKRVR